MVLAIETSCDDTAACLYDGERILSHVVYRQEVHATVGGVIPEWASREHEVKLPLAVVEALSQAGVDWTNLRVVAAAQGPGLLGSLLIGSTFARALAAAWNIPFIGVHHLEAHIASIELGEKPPLYPMIVLVATGGHTHLYRVLHPLRIELLGRTVDDAVGEAFDKVAASLGLPYPGGPQIEKLAAQGNPFAFAFPTPRTTGVWDFSFSGLKTAFLYARRDHPELRTEDLCASWQHAVSVYLTDKLIRAAQAFHIPRIGLVGGVASNQYLRQYLHSQAEKHSLELYLAPLQYCMDNAAMIAVAAWHRYANGLYSPLTETPFAR
ncbi:MAG: tRNA (adenosine(37)-N6)-threonylcarbamoyltransferase complex transferase subunit TsaD [Bacteroidia bacterium]|nr:tRNA (adenosine(37)-N6)-threonylcarbamoyltransferase complex transferase subunit TsaD [Bacteroidia bacterium]MCX7764985.1 tRNA (adenosine(37)-N6)-threonylcarbamoyltransferase complex transferase subunit TsaD [Bacteroidia bacterium]MDW8057141.1 tRNA (adenosine(37)-N6)-threonylcarbamoyltransferase complex transferase subunit TsaD [Bacteroidia bacterium]